MFMLSDADLRAYFEGSGVTVYQLSVMTGKPIEDIKKIVGRLYSEIIIQRIQGGIEQSIQSPQGRIQGRFKVTSRTYKRKKAQTTRRLPRT